MIGTSYSNHSSTARMPNYQTAGRNKKASSSASERKRLGYSVENDKEVFGDTWKKVDRLPHAYELKDGKAIAWIGMEDEGEFRFYHAAESSEDNPVLVARGVDKNGNLFEQKIDLNAIDPYNASNMEIEALTSYYKPKNRFICLPFADVSQYRRGGDRFDFISGLQSAVRANRMNGFFKSAAGYQEDIEFLLSVTKAQTAPDMHGSSAEKGMKALENDMSGIQKSMELCLEAARERLASDMARKYSEKELSDMLWEK